MKKKLEAELISIAHRILKMKNRSELAQLHKEAQNLYEKLSIMIFVEDNFAGSKPTIGHAEVVDQMEQIFEAEQMEESKESVSNKDHDDEKSEVVKEEIVEENISADAKSKEETEVSKDDSANDESVEETKIISETENETESSDDSSIEPENLDLSVDENSSDNNSDVEAQTESADMKNSNNSSSTDEPKKESNYTAEKLDDHGLDHRSSVEFDRKFSESEKTETNIAAESNTQHPTAEATENSEKHQNDSLKQSFSFEPQFQQEKPKTEASRSGQLPLDDLYGDDYKDPEFIKPEDLIKEQAAPRESVIPISRPADTTNVFNIKKDDPKLPLSLNDRLSKGITIGLNDRIAFMKHLFSNSSEDYNRVLSQLMTFDNYPDAVNFIDTMVKPDYNNWEGKDDYSVRFMEIIERKFN